MNPIRMQLTLDVDTKTVTALVDLLTRTIENGTRQCRPSLGKPVRIAEKQPKPPPPKPAPIMRELPRSETSGSQPPPDEAGLLVDTRKACKLLRVSPRKVWQMYNSGQMPKPTRIGRAVRWSYEELRAWANAGCPPANKWQWTPDD